MHAEAWGNSSTPWFWTQELVVFMGLPVEEIHQCNRHEMSYVSLFTNKIGVVRLAANTLAGTR